MVRLRGVKRIPGFGLDESIRSRAALVISSNPSLVLQAELQAVLVAMSGDEWTSMPPTFHLMPRPGDMSLDCDGSSIEFRLPSFFSAPESAEPVLTEQQGVVSRKQADLVIAQQASLLQTAECAALPPKQLQLEVSRILKSCPALPEAHFLSYLNCLRVNDVAGAEFTLYAAFAQVCDLVIALV